MFLNGLRGLCPKCGKCKIFEGWSRLIETCGNCGLVLREREDATWFFMYMSSGMITGVFLVALFFFTPKNFVVGQIVVGVLAVLTFVKTANARKGLAIAIDYWVDKKSRHPRFPV